MKPKQQGKKRSKARTTTVSGATHSAADLRSLISAMRDFILIIDAQGHIRKVTPTNPDLLYDPADEIIGKSIAEIFPASQADLFMSHIRRALEEREAIHTEYSAPMGDREAWFSVAISPRTKDSVVWLARDNTEIKRAKEATRKAEERFRSLFENAVIGMYQSTPNGNLLIANQALVQMLGYDSVADLLTLDIEKNLYVDVQVRKKNLETLRRTGRISGVEYELWKKDGSSITVSEHSRSILNSAGQVDYYEGTIIDVTERKRAEAALRVSEDRYRDLVEHSHDLIGTHDLEGRILSVNQATTKLLGYDQSVLLGRNVREFLAPEFQHEFDRYLTMIRSQRVAAGFLQAQTHAGERRIWEYHSTIRTEGVEAPLVRAMAHDITDRKRAERRLRRINECFLSFGTDPLENINRLTALCGELLGATTSLYNRLHQGMLSSWGQWNTPPGFNREDQPKGHICYDVIRQRHDGLMVVRHLDQTPYVESDPNVRAFNLKTYVGRPVRVAGEQVGALCVVYQKDYIPSEDDRRVMGVIASAIGVEEMRMQSRQELHDANETLRALIHASPLAITCLDAEKRVVMWNKASESLFGWSEQEVMGRPDPAAPKEDRAEYDGVFERVMAGEAALGMETQRVRKDGSVLDVSISAAPMRDSNGKVKAGIALIADNSERKRSERERQVIFEIIEGVNHTANLDELLRLIHKSLQRIIYAENFFVALYDPQKDVFEFPFFVDQYDESPGPMQAGKTCSGYVFRTGRPILITAEVSRQLEAQGEVELVGTFCPAWLGVPLNTPAGIIGVLVVQHYENPDAYDQKDVEFLASVGNQIALAIERKRTEDALRQSEERYRAFMQHSSEGIWRFEAERPISTSLSIDEQVDQFFRYAYIAESNDVMAEMYGFHRAQEILGTRLANIWPGSEPKNIELIRQFVGSGYRLVNAESLELTKDGKPRCFLNNVVGIIEGGSLVRVWGMQRDITTQKLTEEALIESENRYRRLVELSPEAIVVHSEGRFVFANEAAVKLFGAESPEQLLGTPILDRVHPDYRDTVEERVRNLIEGREEVPLIEERFLRFDGTTIDVEVTAIPLVYRNKPAAQVVIRDVTARRQSEETLRAYARQQAAIAKLGQRALANMPLQTFFNEAVSIIAETLEVDFCKILELLPDTGELLLRAGVGWNNGLVGSLKVRIGADSSAGFALLSSEPVVMEDLRLETQIQGPALLHEHGIVSGMSVIIGSKERPFGVLGADSTRRRAFSQEDVHFLQAAAHVLAEAIERQRAEESERRLLLAVEQTDEVVFMTELDGTITYVNPAFEKAYGYKPEEVIGRTPRVLKSGVLSSQYYEQFWKTLLSGKSFRDEIPNKAKDGHLVTVETSVNPVVNPQGVMIGFITVQDDVTERKHLENQLRQAQKMEAVGRLAGGVAHDFNNLLTAITGYSDLMLMRLPFGDGLRRHAEEIKKASDRAASLTQQLLAFSRKQVLQPKILDLNAVVADMEKMLRRLIGEDIELITSRSPGLGKTRVDPGQVAQVLMNLAVNARDAMPQGGKVIIETSNADIDEVYASHFPGMQAGSYVTLAVSDTGCGMDAETQKHLFEPFFTTKAMGKGTGLGLSTVYGIVKQSGGYIWVDSEVGRGSTFKVYLPRLDEGPKGLQAKPEQGTLLQGTETILLVEDEEGVRALVRDILQMNGYTVLEASTGKQALNLCEQYGGSIHLMLTDMVMPQMSGRELAEQMAIFKPEIKVLYMSGYTDDAILHHGTFEADLAFIQKPFSPDALARKVRDMIDRRPTDAHGTH